MQFQTLNRHILYFRKQFFWWDLMADWTLGVLPPNGHFNNLRFAMEPHFPSLLRAVLSDPPHFQLWLLFKQTVLIKNPQCCFNYTSVLQLNFFFFLWTNRSWSLIRKVRPQIKIYPHVISNPLPLCSSLDRNFSGFIKMSYPFCLIGFGHEAE